MCLKVVPLLAAHVGCCLPSWPEDGPKDLQDDHHKAQDAPKLLPKVAFQTSKMAFQTPKMAVKPPRWPLQPLNLRWPWNSFFHSRASIPKPSEHH